MAWWRSVTAGSSLVLGVVSAGVGAGLPGCGSPEAAARSASPAFEGTYLPADPSTKAELSILTLNPQGTYSSVQPGCQSSACRAHGTFTFDGEHTLTLHDAVSPAAQTISVSSLSLGASPASSTASSVSIAALVSGNGVTLVNGDSSASRGAIVESAMMNGVAMKRQHAASLPPPRIFISPNADVTLGATDWQTPFAHPMKWPTTLASTGVIQLYESDIAAILAATPSFVPMVKGHHLEVSIEGTPLVSDACDDAGYPADKSMDAKERFVATYTAELMNADFQPIYDAGGTITYVQLDGDGIEPVVSSDPSLHCNFTVEQAAQAQVYFLAAMAATHPEIQFGLIANFPNYKYIDTTCYWNSSQCDQPFPGRDYADVLDAQISIIQGGGQSIYFVHVDNPYMYLFNHPTLDDVMGERIVPLRDQVVSRGLRFGLILNAEIDGASGAAGDQPFHDQTVADATFAATNGLGSEDDCIVESWFDYPSAILPETTPNTFAATANDTIAAFLTASGR